jgi:hypothetical protein
MAKLTLDDITSGYASVTVINSNNALIETALENTLSRDGTTPNSMAADLDMDSNKVLNLATPTSGADAANKAYVDAVAASANDGDTLAVLLADTDEVTNGDALVGVLSPETGAVATTQHARNHLAVLVADFLSEAEIQQSKTIAVAFDASAAIQAAIDTGKDVDFRGLRWLKANNLTQTTDFQNLMCSDGICRISKNANGVLFASSGDNVIVDSIQFRGDAATPVYTGDNVTFSGDFCTLVRGGSRWAYGRAIKATGTNFSLHASTDIIQTADATASGYDIELGVSGTATLYHQIENYISSQSDGGILMIDTGSVVISGGQFGKLTIQRGTGPAGVNGGITTGARILGTTVIEAASAVFTGNQFSNVSITFSADTSGCRMGLSNSFQAGHTITNNGNDNNYIARQVSSGSTIDIKYGDDTSTCIVSYSPTTTPLVGFPDAIFIPNNKNIYVKATDGSVGARMASNASDNVTFGNDVSAKVINVNQVGLGDVQLVTNNVVRLKANATGIYLGGTTAFDSQGAGSPEGAVTAPVGSTYRRTDGGAATSFYVKESGSGNTGWVGK